MYTLARFDLTNQGLSLLGGRRRRYHYVDHAARASIALIILTPNAPSGFEPAIFC
jgi:hypothetical protein